MRFGTTLRKSIYPPWKDQYIDYDKLKKLLRDIDSAPASPTDPDEEEPWTEHDESAFVEELVNVQLEKVHDFQKTQSQRLRDLISACEGKLEPLAASEKEEEEVGVKDAEGATNGDNDGKGKEPVKKVEVSNEEKEKVLKETLKELDRIAKEVNELERYSRINYTGFLKAAKKHDRKRGHDYRIKPLLQVRLAALPFNTDDYSSMLYRLSAMYSFIRQSQGEKDQKNISKSFDAQTGGEAFTSHKFWIHLENIHEVKTVILRRLPVLVYNPQTSKIAEGLQRDPTITSLYFDNPKLSLYTKKANYTKTASANLDAASVRLRWYGQLAEKPEILLEKKMMKEGGASKEQRINIKEKYIQSFIKGEYKMEKSVNKLQDRVGDNAEAVDQYQKTVDDIQSFIKNNHLQPVLRANYTRTAFQIPGDDRVRISLDTDLALIREDAFDQERPCRDPDDWHRRDIDDNEMEYPFDKIRKGEINRFPFALLEIKIKGNKKYEWVSDLMDSHLVKEATDFSKFVHGVAVLFEDQVNTLPFWLPNVETDIRRDPFQAFAEAQERSKKAAEDEVVVGSWFGVHHSPFRPAVTSPAGSPVPSKSHMDANASGKATVEMARRASMAAQKAARGKGVITMEDVDDEDGEDREESELATTSGFLSLFPNFSTSKYAKAQRSLQKVPAGVKDPGIWIKDQAPVKVEAKVWLANQRTFVKWQHISVLLASLSLGLYNAAGQGNPIARTLAIAYTSVAVFAGLWGWGVYVWRSKLIETRSGMDFDNRLGPTVVCLGLLVALLLNFGFKYHAIMQERQPGGVHHNGTHGTF